MSQHSREDKTQLQRILTITQRNSGPLYISSGSLLSCAQQQFCCNKERMWQRCVNIAVLSQNRDENGLWLSSQWGSSVWHSVSLSFFLSFSLFPFSLALRHSKASLVKTMFLLSGIKCTSWQPSCIRLSICFDICVTCCVSHRKSCFSTFVKFIIPLPSSIYLKIQIPRCFLKVSECICCFHNEHQEFKNVLSFPSWNQIFSEYFTKIGWPLCWWSQFILVRRS